MTGELVRPSFAGELARTRAETLAEAYDALEAVVRAEAGFAARLADERSRLEDESGYLLGSLGAAQRFLSGDAEHGGLEAAVAEGRESMESAREGLEAWAAEEGARIAAAHEEAEAQVAERAEAYAAHRVPELSVKVARVAGGRRVVHLDRPTRDDAVILCALLAGRPPSRHDFLEDDAVDVVDGPVHLAVRTAGIDPAAVAEGGAEAEDALATDPGHRLLPIRAHLPVRLPDVEWPRMRFVLRGRIVELESRHEGEPYAPLVPTADAELLTGYLVSLKIRGLVAVDLEVE